MFLKITHPIRTQVQRVRKGRAGVSALELVLMTTLLMVGLLAFSRAVVGTMKLSRTNRETALATEASRRMVERMTGASFAQAFALYNADPADDPGGPGTAPGPRFAVDGLDPADGDADQMVGEIVFPTVGLELREDVVDRDLGTPRDMNLDGVIDALDHSGDYFVLPVLVRLWWKGATGERTLEFKTLLAAR